MSSDEDSESHEKNLGLSMSYTPDSDELIADVLDDEDYRNSENNDEFNAVNEMNKEAIDSISYSSNSSDDGQASEGEDAIDVSHSSNAANYSHDAMVGTPDVNLKVEQYEETKKEDENIPSFDEAKEKNANISYSSSDDDDDSSSDSDTSTSSSDDDDDDDDGAMTISSTDVNHDGIQYNEKSINGSKTLRQSTAPISEFDRAMASTQEAQTQKKKFVYDGSPDRPNNKTLGIDPPPPPPVSDGVSEHISPSNASLVSGSEIDRVQTIDEDDDVVELALSGSRSYEKETKVDLIKVASSSDEIDPMKLIQSMSADSVDDQSRIVDSEMTDTNLSSVVASQSNSKSLAQQIKQSIDATPSKPLSKNLNPQQELPTMKIMNNVPPTTTIRTKSNDIPSNVIPDVLKQVGDKFDSLFESERRAVGWKDEDEQAQLNRENIRRTFQQLVGPAVLASLAHKKHERRTIASIEIQTAVKGLVNAREFDRVKGVILLLTDDYIRSTNEDARKGGVIAMASCAIALRVQKKSRMSELTGKTKECMDMILGNVVHCCCDNNQRVRYYSIESLFNVIKVHPILALENFFIVFEILCACTADVDHQVQVGAEYFDEFLSKMIIGAINGGQFSVDKCIPLFARHLHLRNKDTKKLTLRWIHTFAESLIGAPLLEFLHLFLYDIFAMLADPSPSIHEQALAFLNLMLPKLWMKNEDFEDSSTYNKIDFDKILQSLTITMEHPDPFVRKVAMYWVFRIVQAHMGDENKVKGSNAEDAGNQQNTHALVSVRSALEHVLPGLLLSIGDTFQSRAKIRDTFLPDQTTHYLADQTNRCLQNNVRLQGANYVAHLGGFVVALREELDTQGGLSAKNRLAKEREPYRQDVRDDGKGIERTGWFHTEADEKTKDPEYAAHENIVSRLCALDWIVLLFEYVVPDVLKDEYAEEFITPVIRLLDNAPETVVLKSLEVLSKITVPSKKNVELEKSPALSATSSSNAIFQKSAKDLDAGDNHQTHPMTDANATYALGILGTEDKARLSRNRDVFAALVKTRAKHPGSVSSMSRIIKHMCSLQPPEFIYISFGLELDIFLAKSFADRARALEKQPINSKVQKHEDAKIAGNLEFATKFVQILSNVFLTCKETERLRVLLKGSIGNKGNTTRDERKAQMFHILLKTFANDPVASISLCLWCGAFRTASNYIHRINPLDLTIGFYIEMDQLVEFIERPLFRDLHLQMLECDENPANEGSGAMLYRVLKSLLMLLPQSKSYNILKSRLLAVARFRQCAVNLQGMSSVDIRGTSAEVFVHRILEVRQLHCDEKWKGIRAESLEPFDNFDDVDVHEYRRSWLGYKNAKEEQEGREKIRSMHRTRTIEEEKEFSLKGYRGFHKDGASLDDKEEKTEEENNDDDSEQNSKEWKEAWVDE